MEINKNKQEDSPHFIMISLGYFILCAFIALISDLNGTIMPLGIRLVQLFIYLFMVFLLTSLFSYLCTLKALPSVLSLEEKISKISIIEVYLAALFFYVL